MTYEELMEKKPGFWNWDIFMLNNEISFYFYVTLGFMILLGMLFKSSIKKDKSITKKQHNIIGRSFTVAAVILGSLLWLGAYADLKQGEWENTYVKEYVKEQNITGEVLVDDIRYEYVNSGGKVYAEVQFPMNDEVQNVKAEVIEKDVDKTYLKYYVNDKDIAGVYDKGKAYFGELYVSKGSIGKEVVIEDD